MKIVYICGYDGSECKKYRVELDEEGNVKENVIISIDGEGLDIGFNSKYLIDVLKVIDDENINLELNTSISPCLVKPIEGNEFVYLILPVRLSGN